MSVLEAYEQLLATLRAAQSDQRTERDRILAICITETQKMRAFYVVEGVPLEQPATQPDPAPVPEPAPEPVPTPVPEPVPEPVPTPPPAATYRVSLSIDKAQTPRAMHLKNGLSIIDNDVLSASQATRFNGMVDFGKEGFVAINFHGSGGFGQADMWHWDGTGTRPAKPTNTGSLVAVTKAALRFRKPIVLTVFRPSWHMRRNRGTKQSYNQHQWSNESGRLAGESLADWDVMVQEMFVVVRTEMDKVDPNLPIYIQVHNEAKGMWEWLVRDQVVRGQRWAEGENPGTPGYGDIDYGPYYKLTVEAVRKGMARTRTAETLVKFGGPYPVLAGEGNRDVDAVPTTHPLGNRPWGSAIVAATSFMEKFIQYVQKNKLPLDFFVIDASTRNRDGVHTQKGFQQVYKLAEMQAWTNDLLAKYGLKIPVWWAEFYAKEPEPVPGQKTLPAWEDSPEYRAAIKLKALALLAYEGADTILHWGPDGQGDDPGNHRNGRMFDDGGKPTVVYKAITAIPGTFRQGEALYAVKVEGGDAYALAARDRMVVLNEGREAMTFGWAGIQTAITIPPLEWRVVNHNLLG